MLTSINEFISALKNEGFSEAESKSYIELLIDNQILISDTEINVTGDNSLKLLNKKLNINSKNRKNLDSILDVLDDLDNKIGNSLNTYQKLFCLLDDLGIPYQKNNLIQTDLFISTTNNNLDQRIGYELKRVIPILSKLTTYKQNYRLEKFKKEFIKRYETREIPLAIALDIETGIPYNHNSISDTTPFLENITPNKTSRDEELINWSSIDKILHQKLIQAIHNNDYTIKITHQDLNKIDCEWDKIPNTISAFTEISKVNNEEKIFIQGFGGFGARLLGRFAHLDKTLLNHIKNICSLEKELEKNKILTEIVHLPEARTGNILKRPHLREKELVYLGNSTLPIENQIFIDDLLVSVKNDIVILKSKKYNKIIEPRLTNAHNYQNKSLPIYNFLCDLQFQNLKQYLGFSWPQICKEHPFLPRVEYNKIIISKAKWHIEQNLIKELNLNYSKNDELIKLISLWRKKYQVPSMVKLVEDDNTLLIDLENLDSIKMMIMSFKNKKRPILEEFLFTKESISKRENENFSNECIITFYNGHKQNSVK